MQLEKEVLHQEQVQREVQRQTQLGSELQLEPVLPAESRLRNLAERLLGNYKALGEQQMWQSCTPERKALSVDASWLLTLRADSAGASSTRAR